MNRMLLKSRTTLSAKRCGPVVVATRRHSVAVRVAAVEPEQAEFVLEQPQVAEASVANDDSALTEEHELLKLDVAQEQLLNWMLNKTEAEQEADLDEMVDYDEFADDEYEDMFDEVEEMLEETDYEFKVGDKIMGTVIEVDEDGAYVEIGAKATAFCPITECSFAKLKSVSTTNALLLCSWRPFMSDTSAAVVVFSVCFNILR
jgi:small subunit ribosomal protein S1